MKHHWAILSLAALTLLFYWRITRHLSGDQWPSDLEDGANVAWNFWYFPRQLLSGRNPFVTHDIFYPVGAPLAFHTYTPLVGLLTWPIAQLFGLPTAYGVATLAGPFLSGLGAYFLSFHLVRDRWAALFAGSAYLMLPDRVLRMAGHMNLNHTEMLPFALLLLLRFYERPSRRNALWLGAVMGLSLYVEAIFTAFLVIAFLGVIVLRRRETFTRPYLVAWGQATAMGAALALPVLIAMVAYAFQDGLDPIPGWGAADVTSADLLSYVVPSAFNPIWQDSFFADAYSKWTGGERFTFVGWSVLALAALAFWRWQSPHKRTLAVLTAVFAVLSLGPFLHVAGWQGDLFEFHRTRFAFPLPYFLLHFVPVFNELRIPARFGFMTGLLLAVLAAAGLRWTLDRWVPRGRAWWRPAVAACAILLLAVECLPGDVPVFSRPDIPAPYDAIAADPGRRAVLELPLQWRDGYGRTGDAASGRDHTVFMYYATHHGKPLAGGMVSRYPDEREARLQEISVYRQVLSLQGDRAEEPATFDDQDLRELGIGYVVGHRDRPVPRAFDYVASLRMPVLADDGTTIVWRVPP